MGCWVDCHIAPLEERAICSEACHNGGPPLGIAGLVTAAILSTFRTAEPERRLRPLPTCLRLASCVLAPLQFHPHLFPNQVNWKIGADL